MSSSFWFGNEKVYLLTTVGHWKIRFEMLFVAYGWMSAEYYNFSLDDEAHNYTLHIDGYSGDFGDGMMYTGDSGYFNHNGRPFQTFDNLSNSHYTITNSTDKWPCPVARGGGWWFNCFVCFACFACFEVLLNGFYDYYNFIW